MSTETTPAVRFRKTRPAARYVRPADVRALRLHLELGWRIWRTAKDHFGPGEHALVLVLEVA